MVGCQHNQPLDTMCLKRRARSKVGEMVETYVALTISILTILSMSHAIAEPEETIGSIV